MFAAWGRIVHRFRWPVLVLSALLLTVSGLIVAQGAKLESGGFIETAESGRASRLIERELPRAGAATFTLLFSSPTLSASDPAFRAEVERALAPLKADPRVATIQSPYDGSVADPTTLMSKDGHAAAITVATKDDLTVARDYYRELRDLVRSDTLGIQATGVLAIVNGFNVVLQDDLRRAEAVSLPLALVLLLVVFGTVVAAAIPLGVGILAVLGGIAGMFVLARFTEVSIYAENVVTLIGLGVAIDYSLFVANRFREELHARSPRRPAPGPRGDDVVSAVLTTAALVVASIIGQLLTGVPVILLTIVVTALWAAIDARRTRPTMWDGSPVGAAFIGAATLVLWPLFFPWYLGARSVPERAPELTADEKRELADVSRDALARALSTSGRAIAFSGLTVAIGLSGQLFYEGTYLSSMGLAGAIVVASAVLYGLTFLPALLAVLGPRIDLIRIPALRADPGARGMWHRLATAVMARPITVLVPVVAVILIVGSPFLRLHLANGDVTMVPKREESRAAYDRLVSDFPGAGQTHVSVVARYDDRPLAAEHIAGLVELQKRLGELPNVQRVNSIFALDPHLGAAEYGALYALAPEQRPPQIQALVSQIGQQRLDAGLRASVGEHIVVFDVVTAKPAYGEESHGIVRAARDLPAPAGAEKLVTGFPAIDLDTVNYIAEKTPLAVTYVVIATIVVLFLLLGSVVLPLKAVLMNMLSISASFGALVWVFQEGNLSEVLGFTASGGIDPTLPVIMFSTLFGLSMDYEVLLLSRIQEEYARLGDNTLAVAEGLERSGRLITGAAAIMVAVFAAFGLAEILLIKALGMGMALAVAIDATLVRALVVPATMRLLGRANWWAPGPLARLYRRLALGERASGGLAPVAVPTDTP